MFILRNHVYSRRLLSTTTSPPLPTPFSVLVPRPGLLKVCGVGPRPQAFSTSQSCGQRYFHSRVRASLISSPTSLLGPLQLLARWERSSPLWLCRCGRSLRLLAAFGSEASLFRRALLSGVGLRSAVSVPHSYFRAATRSGESESVLLSSISEAARMYSRVARQTPPAKPIPSRVSPPQVPRADSRTAVTRPG